LRKKRHLRRIIIQEEFSPHAVETGVELINTKISRNKSMGAERLKIEI
jgi:hypothetical protein